MDLVFSSKPQVKEFGVVLVSKKMLSGALSGSLSGLKEIIAREKFEGKENQVLFLLNGFLGFERFLVVGVSEKDANAEKVRAAVGTAIRFCQAYKAKKLSISISSIDSLAFDAVSTAVVEAASLANYSFQKYKTKVEERKVPVDTLELVGEFSPAQKKLLLDVLLVCENANFCRDLVNDNSAFVTPTYLSDQAKKVAKQANLKIKVLGQKDLETLKMGCFLAVAQASASEPQLVILEHNGDPSSKEKILLVGKGICFDTGGLDLKPGPSMETMREDMAGAAVVLSVLKSCAELSVKKNIVGIMGITENLIGEKAYRQGDVLTSMKGLTVENNSTDAEGRLVLADCLYYGVKNFDPSFVLSIATLTGSARAAFGVHVAPFCSTDESASKKIFAAGKVTGEAVWEMPLSEVYLGETKSIRADLRQINKAKTNGMIFGAAFLNNFVEEKPYLHLDIAGPVLLEDAPKPYLELGATGFGVRLLFEMLKN